jgi:hypothetical protein
MKKPMHRTNELSCAIPTRPAIEATVTCMASQKTGNEKDGVTDNVTRLISDHFGEEDLQCPEVAKSVNIEGSGAKD